MTIDFPSQPSFTKGIEVKSEPVVVPMDAGPTEITYRAKLSFKNETTEYTLFVDNKYQEAPENPKAETKRQEELGKAVNHLLHFINHSSKGQTFEEKFINCTQKKIEPEFKKENERMIEKLNKHMTGSSLSKELVNVSSTIENAASKVVEFLKEGLNSIIKHLPKPSKEKAEIPLASRNMEPELVFKEGRRPLRSMENSFKEPVRKMTVPSRPDPALLAAGKEAADEEKNETEPTSASVSTSPSVVETAPPAGVPLPLDLTRGTLPRILTRLEDQVKKGETLSEKDRELLMDMKEMCEGGHVPEKFAESLLPRINGLIDLGDTDDMPALEPDEDDENVEESATPQTEARVETSTTSAPTPLELTPETFRRTLTGLEGKAQKNEDFSNEEKKTLEKMLEMTNSGSIPNAALYMARVNKLLSR